MPRIITCRCGQRLPITEDMLGKKARCPKCSVVLQLPAQLPTRAKAPQPPPAPSAPAPSAPAPSAPAPPAEPAGDPSGDIGSLGFEGDPSAPPAPKPAAQPAPKPVPAPPPVPAPALEEPALEEPALEEPALEEPALEEPALEEPAGDKKEEPSIPEADDIKLDLDTNDSSALARDEMSLEVTDKHSTKHEEAADSSPLSESFVGPDHESEEEKTKKQEAIQLAREAAEGLAALGEPPPPGSEIRDFKCSIHKKTPARDFCPQCQHPYCSKCLQDFQDRGILCYYCREPLVKGVHTERKVAKRKKRIKWSAVFTVTAAVVTVGIIAFWQIYQPFAPGDLPPEVTIEQIDPAPLRLPPQVTMMQLEPPPGFLPPWAPTELVSPPPKDLPPLVAMHRLDPPPSSIPPEAPLELVSPEIAAILRRESELHNKIFIALEKEVTRLKEEYTKGTSTERTRTLKRLFDLDHRLSLEPLTTALQDPDEKVRGLAATELGRFGSSRVVKPLSDALPKEKSSKVRAKIASALKTCGDESAFPALIEALSDKEFQVRAAAYTALRRLSSQNIRYSALRDPAEQKDAINQWKVWFANSKNKVIHGDWYRMRTPLGQAIAVNRFHGPRARSAVDNALKWLLTVQEEEGYWEQAKFAQIYKKPGEETGVKYIRPGHNLGLTGLALLVFLANGHTPEVGKYKKDVSKIVDWMLKTQRENGRFQYQNSMLYGHGICTMAICEAYGMTSEERYKKPAMKAIEYIVNTQGRHGGFGYNGPGYDVSVSGWQFMAMAAAMESGLPVPERAIRKSRYFLNYMYFKEDGSTGYSVDTKTKERRKGSTAMTAVGIVCRQFLEYPKTYNEIQKSMEKLRSVFGPNNAKNWKCRPTNPYEMYYATLAMFQAGGEDWAKWNRAFRDALLKLQEKEGPFKGAWPEKVTHGTSGGRLYSTTISALCLSVYYRYPPIYK